MVLGLTAPQLASFGSILIGIFTGKWWLLFLGGAFFAYPFISKLNLPPTAMMVIVLVVIIMLISKKK